MHKPAVIAEKNANFHTTDLFEITFIETRPSLNYDVQYGVRTCNSPYLLAVQENHKT